MARAGGDVRPIADILVVGGGPTGLAVALQATAHGAHVRVVDERHEAWRPSRAMILHPSTLERLRPLRVSDALLDRADPSPRTALHLGRRTTRVGVGRLALSDTAFPHVTLVRQAEVERVLTGRLAELGVQVERGVRLRDVDSTTEGFARATLCTRSGARRIISRFLVGCDGRGSAVRQSADIGWRGGPYPVEVVLADVDIDGNLEPDVLHVVVARDGLLFLFALGETATWRLLTTRSATNQASGRTDFGQPGASVPAAEIQRLLDASAVDARVTRLGWSAVVPLERRLADSYRAGALFLAGDAAHTHSPAGGQGMNTGIQDGVNLGWKLAFAAAHGGSRSPLLDSYEQERRPVARHVRALTDLIFFAEASTHPLAVLLRGWLAPCGARALPLLLRRRRLVAEGYRFLAQLRVHYRDSPLSREGTPLAANGPHPGDRLPDRVVTCGGRTTRLHDLTARPGVHVFLSQDASELSQPDVGDLVSIHRLTDQPGQGLLAVRPDGFVGFRCGRSDAAQLLAWLDSVSAR